MFEQPTKPTLPKRLTSCIALFAVAATAGGLGVVNAPGSGAAVRAVPFRQYASCPKLSAALRTMLLPMVGPYGLNGPVYSGTGGIKKRTKSGVVPTPLPSITAAPSAARANPASIPEAATGQPAPAVAVDAAPNFAGASAQANSSATNVQEIGVDEGDSVENDGRFLFATVNGAVRIVDTETGKVVANLGTANGSEQLLLDKNRLAITRTAFDTVPETVVDLWDVTNRSQPNRLSQTHLEGTPLAVRTVGGRARIVLQSNFGERVQFVQPQGFIQPGANTDYEAELARAQKINRSIVQKSQASDWLPRSYVIYSDNTQSPVKTALDCREVGRPANTNSIGFTWVATLDLDIPNPRYGARGSGGVIAGGQTVYASAGNLYVSTQRANQFFGGPVPVGSARSIAPIRANTQVDIHKFDLTPPDGATYRASGTVPGALLNSFSMSEFDGNLRVATTQDAAGFGSPSASSVFVLRQGGSELNPIGRIDGLGRTERIYAVRFVGDIGYVVTFRRTDPLYVLDLRNPTAPRLIGELKIPGYSSYLQPIAPGRLLGIGQDADQNGRVTGTQLSLFDVSDPTNPTQLSTLKVGGQSNAEYDHHAFLWWPATKNIMIPSTVYTPQGGPKGGLLVTSLENDKLTEKGRVAHEDMVEYYTYDGAVPLPTPATAVAPVVLPTPPAVSPILPFPATTMVSAPKQPIRQLGDEPINRSLVVNGKLVTVSQNAVKSSNLDSLTPVWYLKRPS